MSIWRSIPAARCPRSSTAISPLRRTSRFSATSPTGFHKPVSPATAVHDKRAEANRWAAYCNADLHPAFHPLFAPADFIGEATHFDAVKQAARERIRAIYERAERQLGNGDWLAGFRSYADPYLYITLRWARKTGVDLAGYESLAAFMRRMETDRGVRAALDTEGLA